MTIFPQGLSLALIGAGLTALGLPGLSTAATAAPGTAQATVAEDALVAQLREEADAAVRVSGESATGKVGFARVARGGDLLPGFDGTAVAKADAFLSEYAAVFGATDAQLVSLGAQRTDYGTTVTYVQEHRGLRVFGSQVRVNLDRQGDLTSVNGYAAPGLTLSTTPALTETEAADAAVAAVRADPPGTGDGEADLSGLAAASTELVVYRLGATRGDRGPARLVYVVEVGNGANVREQVFVDAGTGKLVNRYSMVHDALERVLHETDAAIPPVWREGDPFPGALNAQQSNIVDYSGDAYRLFAHAFGRDSYDGAGAPLRAVNNSPDLFCPNASWNGSTANFCTGTTADDIVAHEWAHAYTEYTHDLIYQWQSGALNEAYSDIFGETADLLNGKGDEGEGDLTAPRTVGQCAAHTADSPVVVINSPATIAKSCQVADALFGPRLTGAGVSADVVQGRTQTGSFLGCAPLITDLTGKIAMIDNGLCPFTTKVLNAQNAGAVGVLISNTVESVSLMSGTEPAIRIPSVMILPSDKALMLRQLNAGVSVNVTIRDTKGDRADSYRWLIGEQATGFNGAIRDMWTPTCYGDPGKVSDAQYVCEATDGGGVHSNSGVPNHGFALLVDGGTYNGVTVPGIGLDKAAHVYYRAMTAYQTPTSDFVDHADALQASCADLVDQPITALDVAVDAVATPADPVTTTDCAAVAAAVAAVELRVEPVQCNFRPMLDPNTPEVCGPQSKTTVVWQDDFETGLTNWTLEEEVVNPGAPALAWEASTSAPLGHTGGVAYAPDPDIGDCTKTEGNVAGRSSIISPLIELPIAGGRSSRLSFDHSMATEAGYDGGNVKIKVDGASTWSLVPASAYVWNAPRTTMVSAPGNTSPLAGQVGFTGTDGGSLEGAWGQSQIDLTRAGALPGSTVQLRFDFGRDGCVGRDGWYVDDVSVTICKSRVALTASHNPSPSRFGRASSVDVRVQRAGTVGLPPTGVAILKDPAGIWLGRELVVDGAASIPLDPDFPVGTTELTVAYRGLDTSFADESVPVGVVVERAQAVTEARASPNPVQATRPLQVVVTAQAPGVQPFGNVEIWTAGEVVGRAGLVAGSTRVVINRNFAPGARMFMARYLGSATVAADSDFFWVRINP